ncbi:NADP-dependent oxidoreductase domain-containing protein [Apodospora peruviana]|uniref:NADP-dependent oxidoreductase domain-containing protein n=1 Tax=Apodospora peruviana TaxID=516989 RepID=A0AAE0HZ97_9PEZI|nr:NADP-dependent oxidoreductase domain-containing protein [Apodospora peruviana]
MSKMTIPKKPLGRNGPLLPPIGFGAMGLGYQSTSVVPISDEDRLAVLDRAHSIGCTFWDTSDYYGDAEALIGKWFTRSNKRSEIFIATKFGAIPHADGSFTFRGDAAYVREACNNSLTKFGIDTIDLLYPHRLDGSTPVEEIISELVKLKTEGKIKHIGLSEVSPTTLRRAYAIHPIACVQMEYSAFSTDVEKPVRPPADDPNAKEESLISVCRELGVAIVCYSPMSRGMLTGTITNPDNFDERDYRRNFPRFSAENFGKNLEVVEVFKRVAERKGESVTAGQVALAWLLAQGGDIFPIPGTTKTKYVEENFAALQITLTPDEEAEIRSLVDKASVAGDRYPAEMALGLFSDTPLPK